MNRKETTTQRKRRLAKAKLKRQEKKKHLAFIERTIMLLQASRVSQAAKQRIVKAEDQQKIMSQTNPEGTPPGDSEGTPPGDPGVSSGDPKAVFIKMEMDVDETLSKHLEMLENGARQENSFTSLHTEENFDIEIKQEVPESEPKYEEVQVHDKNNLLVEKRSTKAKAVPTVIIQPDLMTEIKTEDLPGTSNFAQDQEMPVDYQYEEGMQNAALANVEACLDDIKSEDGAFDYPDQPDSALQAEIKIETEIEIEPELNTEALSETTSTITRSSDLDSTIANVGSSDNNEEILPNELFQLNSITGDELTLEQLQDPNFIKERVPCPKCPKTYRNKNALGKHLAVHVTVENYERGKVTRKLKMLEKRKLREGSSDTTDSITTSVDEEISNYTCTCGKSFRRGILMESCMKSHDFVERSEHYCAPCAKEFDTKDALVQHRKRLHSRKKFPCKFCPTDYNTQKELFKHLQLHQKVQLTEYKVMSGVVDGTVELKCFVCLKSSSELADLKTHILNDHKAPYICKCNKKITKMVDYISHYQTHMDNSDSVLQALEAFSKLAEDWKCEECNLNFTAADSLAVHRLETHTLESKTVETFQCEDCRRAFTSAKSMNSHRRVHHNTTNPEPEQVEETLQFLCVYCRKVCKDENALTSHLRLHSPDRKFVCKFCDFRFSTAEKRKTHAEIHTGDLKFVCFICEYQCSSLQRLSNHKKTPKHLSMKDYLLTGVLPDFLKEKKSEKIEPKKRKSKEEVTSCDICGDTFSSAKVMLEHKQTHPFISFVNEAEPTRIFFK